jgi:hypothetical protein
VAAFHNRLWTLLPQPKGAAARYRVEE